MPSNGPTSAARTCLARTSTVRTAPIACRRTTHDKTAPAAHRTMVSGCLYKPGDHRRSCALRPSRKRGSIHRPSAPPRVEPRLLSPCHHFASCSSATGDAWCSHPMRPSRSQTSRGYCQTGDGPRTLSASRTGSPRRTPCNSNHIKPSQSQTPVNSFVTAATVQQTVPVSPRQAMSLGSPGPAASCRRTIGSGSVASRWPGRSDHGHEPSSTPRGTVAEFVADRAGAWSTTSATRP